MFEFRAFPSRSGACAAGSTVRSVLVTGSCVCVFQPWPQNYPELLLHMKPLTPQQLYPMPFPPAPVQTPLWTVVGAVPLLADGNSKRLEGEPGHGAARHRLLAECRRYRHHWRDELPGDGIRFDRSSRI